MKSSLAHVAEPPSPSRPAATGKRPWRALGMVRSLDFEAPDYRFVHAPFAGNEPVLEGRIRKVQLQPGLHMHGAEAIDLHSMMSKTHLNAGVSVVLVLAGEVDVRIGGQRLQLQADGCGKFASAAIINMPQETVFERRWERGKWERKLSLHITPEWLRSQGWLQNAAQLSLAQATGTDSQSLRFPDQLSITPWYPSAHALALAEQLLCHTDNPADDLARLRLTSRALELLYEAFASQIKQTGSTAPAMAALRPRDRDRMLRLRNFLDAEIQQPLQDPIRIQELGLRFGLSASALQRQFRSAFGTSVNEYRRLMRLLQARTNLEQGGSIAEAAYQAGYTSAANFATAFRRQFGVSPKSLRSRL